MIVYGTRAEEESGLFVPFDMIAVASGARE